MPGCGVRLTSKPFLPNSKELDHIVPRVMGGAHTVGNTRIICRLCNARRPDDASDIDQLSLSSMIDPVALAIATMPRVRRVPKLRSGRVCAGCGGEARRPGRKAWCLDCITERARRGWELRAAGVGWQEIAEQIGLGGTGSTYNVVMRYGRAS